MYRLTVRATTHPETGGVVLVCNHGRSTTGSSSQVRYAARALRDGPPHGGQAGDLARPTGKPFRSHGARRQGGARESLRQDRRRAPCGEVVCISPKGRSPRREMTLQAGIERILRETPVPVVPMALDGLWGTSSAAGWARDAEAAAAISREADADHCASCPGRESNASSRRRVARCSLTRARRRHEAVHGEAASCASRPLLSSGEPARDERRARSLSERERRFFSLVARAAFANRSASSGTSSTADRRHRVSDPGCSRVVARLSTRLDSLAEAVDSR